MASVLQDFGDKPTKELLVLLPQSDRYRKLKLAVAMAIIRSKPSFIHICDYVRKLADDVRNGESNILERCKSLEEEIIHFQQKVAVVNIRSSIRPEALPFRRESSKSRPADIRCNIAERISQHWVFLENYLALVSNTATDNLSESDDLQELMLRSARSLLRAIRNSAPLRSVEMDLCRRALTTLAQTCSKQCAGTSPLHSALTSFVAESIAEMVCWQEPFEASAFLFLFIFWLLKEHSMSL